MGEKSIAILVREKSPALPINLNPFGSILSSWKRKQGSSSK
jgi:hypothetical protein